MNGRKKTRPAGQHGGGHERWLITYADMITLLMAFFIMMYSMSVVNLAKFNDVAFSIRSGFGGTLRGAGPGGKHQFLNGGSRTVVRPPGASDPTDPPRRGPKGKGGGVGGRSDEEFERELSALVFLDHLAHVVAVRRDPRGLVLSIAPDELFFRAGSATLSDKAGAFLSNIAGLLALSGKDVLVEGHTDPAPMRSSRFPSNWELSAARASAVASALEDHGVPGKRLTAIGYGATRAREARGEGDLAAGNRRVDIIIVRSGTEAIGGATPPLLAPEREAARARPDIRPRLTKVWRRELE